MKRIMSLALCAVSLLSMLFLSSCGIAEDVEGSVTYPDSYSLSYEVITEGGEILTLKKSVDSDGNVYYKSSDTELVYIKDGVGYTLYEKGEDGVFASTGQKFTEKAMSEATSEIDRYAEESKNKFVPTAKEVGEETVAGRVADVYRLGVGFDSMGFFHYYYVDRETGVCLKVEERNTVFGRDTAPDGESFICTEFITEGVESVLGLVS